MGKNNENPDLVQEKEKLHPKMGLVAIKPVFGGLRTTKAQTSLRIRAVLSVPLLFAFWKVLYLDLLPAKYQFST